ncbi:DMT family transporter [Candidatus Acidulodesulfobacterium sp. H_13]|uniref:DMT family transporter n=1 Tax=Candidatus Acidulodesulfobacterium sp. H_13 TaxID=3395470 RepID=UPI003AF7C06F
MMKHINKLYVGIFLCLLSAIVWGGMFPIMGIVLKVIDPFYLTLFRYAPASVIFLSMLYFIEGKNSFKLEGRWFSVWVYGSVGFAGFGFFVWWGQQIIGGFHGAIVAAAIMATMPFMGAILNKFLNKTKLAVFTGFAILAGLFGVLLIVTQGDIGRLMSLRLSLGGDILIVAGAFCWVFYTMGITKFPKWSPLRYTALTSIFGFFTILILIIIMTSVGLLRVPGVAAVSSVWWEILYMIFISAVLGVFAWNAGNRIIHPINGVLFLNFVPVTTLMIAILDDQSLSYIEYIGVFIVISALIFNNLYIRKKTT